VRQEGDKEPKAVLPSVSFGVASPIKFKVLASPIRYGPPADRDANGMGKQYGT
jgi:hypothetical protein